MNKVVKHIISIILFLVMIICWILAIGYTNELGLMKNTFNLYLDDENYKPIDIYSIQKQESKEENPIAFTGWYEKENETVKNPNFNREISTNIIFICGNSSLIVKGPLLFEDDKNGCLLDEETAQKLFGSEDIIGNTIIYEDRELVVRGIHKGVKNTIITTALENSEDKIQGIYIDISDGNKKNIQVLNIRYGFKDEGIDSKIYYNIGKLATSLLPIIILLIVVFNLFREVLKNKNKPFFFIVNIVILIFAIFIFFKITKFKISIPVDILPNKWSNFDYWKEFFNDYMERVRYFLYMKKYSMDIYFISYVMKILRCSLISIILLFINIRSIKVQSNKELFISLVLTNIITFIAFVICKDSVIYGGSLKVWLIWPYYLIYKYYMLNKYRLIDKLNNDIG